jgi:hypothetical protein
VQSVHGGSQAGLISIFKGTLAVVGTGMESLGEMTPAARGELCGAQRVFYLGGAIQRAIVDAD